MGLWGLQGANSPGVHYAGNEVVRNGETVELRTTRGRMHDGSNVSAIASVLIMLRRFVPYTRDAWAKRRGLGSQDAKQLYVESMLRVSQLLAAICDNPLGTVLMPWHIRSTDPSKVQRSSTSCGAHPRAREL